MNRALVVPLLPSATDTSLIDSVAASSFVIVPWPWASAIVAPDGLERFTTNVSFASTVVSPLTDTSIVWLVVPAAKVSVPDAAV